MARYYDMDALAEMIRARADMLIEGGQAFYFIANWIDKLHPADVVEVVRCKDCKYWRKFDDKYRTDGQCGELIDRHGSEMWATEGDHFCGYGKRKEITDDKKRNT